MKSEKRVDRERARDSIELRERSLAKGCEGRNGTGGNPLPNPLPLLHFNSLVTVPSKGKRKEKIKEKQESSRKARATAELKTSCRRMLLLVWCSYKVPCQALLLNLCPHAKCSHLTSADRAQAAL